MRKIYRSTLAMIIVFTLAMSPIAYGSEQEESHPYYYSEYQKPWYTIYQQMNPEDYAGLYCKDDQLHILPTNPEKVEAYLDSLGLSAFERENIIIDSPVEYSLAYLNQARKKVLAEEVTYNIRNVYIDIMSNSLVVVPWEYPTKPDIEKIWLADFRQLSGMDTIRMQKLQDFIDEGHWVSDDMGYYSKDYVIVIDPQKPENGIIHCFEYKADCDAYISNDTIMIPIRTLIDAYSETNTELYTIEWIDGKRQVKLWLNDRGAILDLDTNTIHLGKVTVPAYQPFEWKNGKVYVSAKDLGQILRIRGRAFQWDSAINALHYDYKTLPPNACPWDMDGTNSH